MSRVPPRADQAGRAGPVPAGPGYRFALGIDIGTTNTKAVLVGIEGLDIRELAVRSFPTPDAVDDLLAGLAQVSGQVIAAAGIQPDAVGIASMAETCVPLSASGAPLSTLIRWNVRDGAVGADLLGERMGAAALFEATGVPLTAKAPLALWSELEKRDPGLSRRASRWAGTADLAALALTGTLATDHTLAGRTMAYRLPEAGRRLPRTFDRHLLALAGMDPSQLPRVLAPGEPAGTVTPAAAARWGVRAGVPVYIAGHDHAVGAWAAGTRKPGDSADSVGTAEALVTILGDAGASRVEVGESGMSLTRTVDGERESLLAGMAQAGALVSGWFDSIMPGADRDTVFAEAAALGSSPGDILVLPYPSGRQAPAPDRAARLVIRDAAGNPVDVATRPPAELTRGLLVGLALHLRWMVAEQARLAGTGVPERLLVLGGPAAANPVWMSVKAAVLPARLELVRVAEPVASGAALLAAVRAGIADPDSRLPAVPVPAPAGASPGSAYDAAFDAFLAAASAPSLEGTR